MQNVHFTPPKLAEIFGVNESTIKRWIDKGMLKATKSPGGHRRVTQEQLEEFIHNFPKNAPNSYVISQYVESGKEEIDWKEYYTHLLHNRSARAKDILNTAKVHRYSLLEQLEKIVQPSLVNIGLEWEREDISIYQEHRMSFLVRQHFEHLRQMYPQAKKNGKHAVLACAPGDHHEMPLQMADLLLQERGWKTSVLGINIPLEELKAAIAEVEPEMVCLSNIVGDVDPAYLASVSKQTKRQGGELILAGSKWEPGRARKNVHTVSLLADFVAVVESDN